VEQCFQPIPNRDYTKAYREIVKGHFVNLLKPFGRAFILIVVTIGISAANRSVMVSADSARACRYVPGVSVPAQMPADLLTAATPTLSPTATEPPPESVSLQTTARQERIFQALWDAVNDNYVYTDFLGHDWKATGDHYKALIDAGMSDDTFYAVMDTMIEELGDQHSFFQSPKEVESEKAATASRYNFVGIGTLSIPIENRKRAAIMSVFPNSPAAEAGLLPHDTLLKVDGGPLDDANGVSRTLGKEGTPVTLTVQRPGEAPRDITLTRHRVTGMLLVDYCIIPTTRIGYIFLPTLLDDTMADQTHAALQQMTADGPLDGLVIDNRVNAGGFGSMAETIMGFFTGGLQGYFISRTTKDPLVLTPEDIGGSQTIPLIVLVGVNTVSYGEVMSGILRLAGRARIVGDPTLGNVEQLRSYDFMDGSRAWIASATFQPLGESNGIWEATGIIPDYVVPTRWDLFTEATDPALAKAVELLTTSP
jgi:C-terminal peptidase prc